jgi:subtilase family serine protease
MQITPTMLPATSTCAPASRAGAESGTDGMPDLVIKDIGFLPSPPDAGSTAHLVMTVANVGNAPAGAFTVAVSNDAKGTARVAGLAEGEEKRVDFGAMRIPPYAQMLRIDGEIDPSNEVEESREDNNWIISYAPVHNPNQGPTPPPMPPIPVPPPHLLLAE